MPFDPLLAFPGGSARRLAGIGAVMVLLLLGFQGRAPELGRDAAPAEAPAGLDAAAVVERAVHGIVPVAGRPGTLEVRDDRYTANFDASGFSYTPAGASNAFSIYLASVARGRRAASLVLGAWSGTANVAERRVADGVSERVTARDGEVEWDVVLATQPAGVGDLVVTAQLAGIASGPTEVRAAGRPAFRFALEGGASVDLDEVVVRDADGAELHRALPTVDGNEIRLVVPQSVLATAAYPVVVDPTVSGRYTVSNADIQESPAVAFDGSRYLVVWSEYVEMNPPFENHKVIAGAIVNGVDSTVEKLLTISSLTGPNAWAPDVASNGNNFLVTWEEPSGFNTFSIRAMLVTPAGQKYGPVPFDINSNGSQRRPAVTAAGSRWFVAWQDHRNSTWDIFGARVSATAKNLDPNGIPIATTARNEFAPDIAWNGSHTNSFLVAWEVQFSPTDDDIYAQRLSSGANLIGSPTVVSWLASRQRVPAVAAGGLGFLVVWEDDRNGGVNDIYAGRISGSGAVLDGSGDPLSTAGGTQDDPVVAFNGTYLVAWRDQRDGSPDIYAARVTDDGAVQDPAGFVVSASSSEEDSPAVARAAGDGTWAVTYEDGPSDSTSIMLRTVASK